MKNARLFLLFLSALLFLSPFSVPALADGTEQEYPAFEAGVSQINYSGTLILDLDGNKILESGYAYGDIVHVEILDRTMDLPLVENYSEVAVGDALVRVKQGAAGKPGTVYLSINMYSMADSLGLDSKQQSGGITDSFGNPVRVRISMHEKGGYLKTYHLLQVSGSDVRTDYPELSDAEYSNFRAVSMPSIRRFLLYRSSSPIDPSHNRNREADRCLADEEILTVFNMANSEDEMRAFDGFQETAYSKCRIFALDLGMDFTTEDFKDGTARGIRFMLSNEGPYLIHCKEGKDRTGFLYAVLEFLCGAALEDVKEDYMLSYVNFYGVEPGSEKYETIFDNEFIPVLENAFGQHFIAAEEMGSSYSECVEEYLKSCGLSEDEIRQLKQLLGTEPAAEETPTPLSGWDDVLRILAGWYVSHVSPDAVPDAA